MGDGIELDAVLIPNLNLNLQSMEIPDDWQNLDKVFSDQDTFNVEAQILVGANKATLFPHCLKNADGTLVQTSMCRLI